MKETVAFQARVVVVEPSLAAEIREGWLLGAALGEDDESLLPLELGYDLEPQADLVGGQAL